MVIIEDDVLKDDGDDGNSEDDRMGNGPLSGMATVNHCSLKTLDLENVSRHGILGGTWVMVSWCFDIVIVFIK